MIFSKKNKVYIIDDDKDVAQSTVILLQAQGLQTELFHSVEDFLAKTEPTISGCVVSDYALEGNWNGIDLLRKIQDLGYRIPFILASGSLNHSSQLTAEKSGAFAILEKPYPSEILCETIYAALKHNDGRFPN